MNAEYVAEFFHTAILDDVKDAVNYIAEIV